MNETHYQLIGWLAMLLAAFSIPFTIINAMVAYQKNRSVLWAIVMSLIFTPIFAYLYLLAVPPKSKASGTSAITAPSVWKDE